MGFTRVIFLLDRNDWNWKEKESLLPACVWVRLGEVSCRQTTVWRWLEFVKVGMVSKEAGINSSSRHCCLENVSSFGEERQSLHFNRAGRRLLVVMSSIKTHTKSSDEDSDNESSIGSEFFTLVRNISLKNITLTN